MITVEKKDNKVIISGHAKFADHGKDIVCASVSSMVYTTVNAILNFDKDSIKIEDKEDFIITLLKDSKETKILIDNLITLLKDLGESYPKNIKVKGE